jgi:hypothetical protein
VNTRAALFATVLTAAVANSCSETPTGPPFTRTVHRTTGIVVHDSLGAPAGGTEVRLVAEFDSAGIAPVILATTDAAGVASVVLAQGGWGVHGLASGSDPKVAGATFTVPGLPRPEIDTIVVRITLHTPSVARGRVLVGSGTNHAGTIVGCPPAPSVAVTDASGEFVLDLLPLGHWTITMYHPGFRLGLAAIDITAAGDTLEVADVHLIPGPAATTQTLRAAAKDAVRVRGRGSREAVEDAPPSRSRRFSGARAG